MYLAIKNPGVCDPLAFTLLGVSTTRNSGRNDTIGCFGSGAKASLALLLRKNIKIIVYCGLLRMEFFTKPEYIKEQQFNQIYVKYSGVDENGNTKNSTVPLGFSTEWGVADWTKVSYALREYVSNALDSSVCYGGSHKDVEIDVVDKPRATKGTTKVFIDYTADVQKAYASLDYLFLHFKHRDWLNKKILPKRELSSKCTLVYKKGVLVSTIDEPSLFDYNLDDEVQLDESRNVNPYTAKYAISRTLRDASPEQISPILERLIKGEDCLETKLDSCYMEQNEYDSEEVKEKRTKNWQTAFSRVAGPDGVACGESASTANFIQNKGLKPIIVGRLLPVLESYQIKSEKAILSQDELDGKQVIEPTEEMVEAVNWVWNMLERIKLTNGKEKPKVKGFIRLEQGNIAIHGYQQGDTVYLESQIGGDFLRKTTLHEICHWLGGGNMKDETRDWADLLLRVAYESMKLNEKGDKENE